jgi:beta-phosphoglucomutase family hydrolase
MPGHLFKAVIFDLDGVVTDTAKLHTTAWKKAFDDYLQYRSRRDGTPFTEFTLDDYLTYVDGKPRYDGVKSFLESRDINLPYGQPEDTKADETICGIGNSKNDAFRLVLEKNGADVFETTVSLIRELKKNGIHVGVASSSRNCESVLKRAGLLKLFETRVDGVVSAELGLNGKPEADIFLRAASNIGVAPSEAVVVEDAASGVAAGRKGGFGLVLGIAREDNADELLQDGADMVLKDLAEISIEDMDEWFARRPHWTPHSGFKGSKGE